MINNWVPLHNHSHFSLLDCVSKPEKMVKKCVDVGIKSCAITDHGNISGAIAFYQHCKENNIRPILGIEFYICEKDPTIKDSTNKKLSHLIVLAKNLQGWKNLIKAVSYSNRPDIFYYKPRINLEKLSEFSQGQFIIISGHAGSTLANKLFKDVKSAYGSQTYDNAKGFVIDNSYVEMKKLIGLYQDMFGKDNFYLEVQLMDQENMPASQVLAKAWRHMGKNLNIKCVATTDAHYVNKEDAQNQRILLCNFLKTTIHEVNQKIENNEDVTLGSFFKSNKYYMLSPEEMTTINDAEELKASLEIADSCEDYSILNNLQMPTFVCPNGEDSNSYIRKLCEDGFKKVKENHNIYKQRLDHELNTFSEVEKLSKGKISLSNYFLLDWDMCKWIKKQGWLIGPGRGSASGCLTSYLLDITNIDPIEADLSFERFYNAGRNSPGKISLPDIDIDVQKSKRNKIVEYIKNKYGHDKVSQLATFGRMQGRKAIGEVLRAYGKSFDERNTITKFIPDEATIADDLQEMKEEHGSSSIIQWALENKKELKQWCIIENGELSGDYAFFFKQAMQLEGVKNQQGKHASAIIISPNLLEEFCPMIYDKSTKSTVVGYELNDAEAAGLVKYDLLGLSTLDRIKGVQDLLLTGDIND